jgi:hypothetical protein
MDAIRFDNLSKALSSRTSRRTAIRRLGIVGAFAGALGLGLKSESALAVRRGQFGSADECDRRCYSDYEACIHFYGLTLLDAVQGTRPEAQLCEATAGSCLAFCSVSTEGLRQ